MGLTLMFLKCTLSKLQFKQFIAVEQEKQRLKFPFYLISRRNTSRAELNVTYV